MYNKYSVWLYSCDGRTEVELFKDESLVKTKSLNQILDDKQLCIFTSNKNYFKQRYCHTYKLIGNLGFCFVCAQVCHKDHEGIRSSGHLHWICYVLL